MLTRRRLFGFLAALPVVAGAALNAKGKAKEKSTHPAPTFKRFVAMLMSKDNPFGSADRITGGVSDPPALPLGTPVLVTWPGFPPLRAKVIGSGYDGGRPVYQVVSACGCDVWADEAALVDLRPFSDMPAAVFAEAGCG